jgi:hypothetical protein
MLEGRFDEACPKIAESNRIDPHTGTLLNLAACHEKQGKVASAWVEYEKALTAARAEGQAERVRFAQERSDALQARVPWLALDVPQGAPQDLSILLDGAPIQRLAWGKEMPVDPGGHVVKANARDRAPFEESLALAEGEHRTVRVAFVQPTAPVGPEPSTTLIVEPPREASQVARRVPAYAAIFHPLATNIDQPYAKTRFGFNLLYGRAGELENGAQIGLVNLISGKEGVATGDMSGVQLAPLFGFNYASGHASGLQLAFWGNAAGAGLEGAQITLGANVAAGDAAGAQAAFLANVASGDVSGAQVAAVNVARDLRGAQVGFVNVARKMDGFALGLVNIADDIDGVPIAPISITRTGGVHPVVWGSSATYANLGVKFATKHTYTMLAAHYTAMSGVDTTTDGGRPLHADSRDFFGGGFFVGGHVPVDRAFVDFDVGISAYGAPSRSIEIKTDASGATYNHPYNQWALEPRLRVLGGYSFADHASLFVGAGLAVRARMVNDGNDAIVSVLPEALAGVQF